LPRPYRPLGDEGEYVVKNPLSGVFFQSGAVEHFLLLQFDGQRTADEIPASFAEQFGEPLSVDYFGEFLERRVFDGHDRPLGATNAKAAFALIGDNRSPNTLAHEAGHFFGALSENGRYIHDYGHQGTDPRRRRRRRVPLRLAGTGQSGGPLAGRTRPAAGVCAFRPLYPLSPPHSGNEVWETLERMPGRGRTDSGSLLGTRPAPVEAVSTATRYLAGIKQRLVIHRGPSGSSRGRPGPITPWRLNLGTRFLICSGVIKSTSSERQRATPVVRGGVADLQHGSA
jgi:hypothetical protein